MLLHKEMLSTSVYHVDKAIGQLGQISSISSEVMVKDQINYVMRDLKDLTNGIKAELQKNTLHE